MYLMTNISNADLFSYLIAEAEHPFSGWDFSYITGTERMVDAPLLWSYTNHVIWAKRDVQMMLDMGTGGGERLAGLQPLPAQTWATEGYPPNVLLARQRLEPLDVKVVDISKDNQHLPFEDNKFDLIINRHEYYAPREVLRILKPGHQFITQQVGSENAANLNALLGATDYPSATWTLERAVRELQEVGLRIVVQKEDHPITRFFDVGAIVYYLKAIPWQVPNFSVEKYFDKLVAIHNMIQRQGYVDTHNHRFLIIAERVV